MSRCYVLPRPLLAKGHFLNIHLSQYPLWYLISKLTRAATFSPGPLLTEFSVWNVPPRRHPPPPPPPGPPLPNVARVSQLEIADAKFPPEQKWATKNAGFPPPQYSESSRRSRTARLDLRNAQSYLVQMPLTQESGFMVVKLRQQKRKSCWTCTK